MEINHIDVTNDGDQKLPKQNRSTNKNEEKDKGGEERGNSGEIGARGTFSGSPKYLTEKIKEGREDKRDRSKELQEKRKKEYSDERRRNSREDTRTEGEDKKFISVKVKQEKLEESSSSKTKSSLEEAVDLLEGGDLAIDLTKEDKGKPRRKSKRTKEESRRKKEEAKKDDKKNQQSKATKVTPIKAKKAGGNNKTKGGKGGKKAISSAAKAMIDLTKGIGKAKKIATKNKDKSGFDFGYKKPEVSVTEEAGKEGGEKPKEADKPVQRAATGELTQSPATPVINVYATAAQKAKERTVKNKQMVLGSRTKYRSSRRFRVTFTTAGKRGYQGAAKDLTLSQQSTELRLAMINILERAKATCKRVGIHPWVGEQDQEMPTIMDSSQVPKTWGELRRYMTHDDDQFRIQSVRTGSNARWRILLNFDMRDQEEFLHLYQNSKGDWNEYPYVPLMDAPLQSQQYHCLGFLIGSSADQPMQRNEEGISKEMKFEVGLSFGNLPMDREYQNEKWEEARNGGNGKRDTFKSAPQALNVYVDEKSLQARAVMAKTMAKKYSELEGGKYPLFPDGSRMRFMPNYKLVPFNKRTSLETYANLQVTLKKEALELDIGIKNPDQTLPDVKETLGKSIGELILGLTLETTDLPIFRHFTKKYSRKYNPGTWCVSVHPNMSTTAVETLSKLKEIIIEKYGEEVGKLIGRADSYASKAGIQNSTFKPEDSGFEFLDVAKDWYLAGSAKCMIEGMEALKETPEEKEAMDNAVRSIDESRMTFLSNANTAEEIKTVTSEGGVSFGTVSHLSQDGEERTVAMQSATPHMPGYIPPKDPAPPIVKAIEKVVKKKSGTTESDMEIETDIPITQESTDEVMEDTAVNNDTADSLGGSGTQAVDGEETWTRHGTEEDERSLFQSAVQYGLSSLAKSLSPALGGVNTNRTGNGAGGNSLGTQQP